MSDITIVLPGKQNAALNEAAFHSLLRMLSDSNRGFHLGPVGKTSARYVSDNALEERCAVMQYDYLQDQLVLSFRKKGTVEKYYAGEIVYKRPSFSSEDIRRIGWHIEGWISFGVKSRTYTN